jgi:hypothetical protein
VDSVIVFFPFNAISPVQPSAADPPAAVQDTLVDGDGIVVHVSVTGVLVVTVDALLKIR